MSFENWNRYLNETINKSKGVESDNKTDKSESLKRDKQKSLNTDRTRKQV